MAEGSGKALTLLLVGKTGNGKSSTGNTILQVGRDVTRECREFSTAVGFHSDTTEVETETCAWNGRKITVINTPDLHMVHKDRDPAGDLEKLLQKKKKKQTQTEEVGQWFKLTKGHPIDAVLLVIRANCRYTREEFLIYQQLKEALKYHLKQGLPEILVVVFTMGDRLNGRDLRKDLQDTSPELREVLEDARWRYVVFNNNGSPWEKKASADALLRIVDSKDKQPHPFPQQVCRLLLKGNDQLQREIAAILCPRADVKGHSGYFYYSCEPPDQRSRTKEASLSGDEFDGLRLEVTLTPEGREDEETNNVVLCSVSPGPHAFLYVIRSDIITSREAFPTHRQQLQKYPKHHVLVVIGELSEDQKKTLDKPMDTGRILVLPSLSGNSREKLLKKVTETVIKIKGHHFTSHDMDELADDLQDQLSAKHQSTYREYLELKQQLSERYFKSYSS